jgi:hypothetical protein
MREYWWILPTLAWTILLVVLSLRGKQRLVQIIAFLTTCVIILSIPAMHSPLSYVTATAVVVYLLLMARVLTKPATPSGTPDR